MFDQLNDAARDIAIKIGGVDFADEAVGHSKKTIELLCKLRNARRTKNKRLQRELKNAIVKSYPVRFTAVLLKADTDNSILIPDHIREMAGKLDMFNDCGEPVRAWAEPKLPPLNDQAPTSTDANDYRPIFAFGWLRSAGQQLIVWVLEATFEVDEFNHLTKGRGPDAAAEKINQLCVNGLPFVVIADIKNCFRSVQQEGLEKVLELPKAIVSNFLLIRSTVKLLPKPLTTSIGVFGGTALSGLPQGSCASGKITGILLGPTLKSITSTDRIVLHGDDILIAASNQSEAKAFESALKKALETHTYGPFRLKHSSIHTINKGFDFLKYHHRLTWEGKTHLRPSMRCYTRMKRKVQAKITKPEIMLREHLQVYIQRWMKSFPLWKRTYLSLLLLEMSIAEQVGKFVHLLPEWRKQNKVNVDTKNEAKSVPKNKIKSKIIKLKFPIKPSGTGSNTLL